MQSQCSLEEDVRMVVHGGDFVFSPDEDGLKHVVKILKSNYTAKDKGTLRFKDSDVKRLLLLGLVFRGGTDQIGQYLDIEPDLRHAPLIINEQGFNANTKTVSTPRGKLQEKLVLDGRKSRILSNAETTRYKWASVRLSFLAQAFGPRNE